MFHEMMEEDERKNETQIYHGRQEPWTIYHTIAKGLMLLLFGGYPVLLIKGVFLINGFTVVLALFSIVVFIRSLLL